MAKAVRRMRSRSSRTNDRKTKAVAKAVTMMRKQSFRTNGREMKAVAKAVRRMCRWSSCTDGRKTKAVRRMRSRSSHTNGRKTKGSEMDTRMKLTNPESRDYKRTAIARIRWMPRQEGQDAATRLELMLGSRRANFYVLHKINQVVQQKKNNNKEDKKASILNIEKERIPTTTEAKKNSKNSAQFILTHKTSSPFIEVALARNPSNL